MMVAASAPLPGEPVPQRREAGGGFSMVDDARHTTHDTRRTEDRGRWTEDGELIASRYNSSQTMSKYRIYRSNASDPEHERKRNKWFYSAYIILFMLLTQIPNYCIALKTIKFKTPLFIILAAIVVACIFLLSRYFRSRLKTLIQIGTLEFTRTAVRKEIGDLSDTSDYSEISRIELGNFYRDVSLSWNKPGTMTKSIKIVHANHREEAFIISNRSVDFRQKVCIADSLKTLKKLTGIEIHIDDK
jgi:hypothetical protein